MLKRFCAVTIFVNMVTLGEMYIKFKFKGSGAHYLRFGMLGRNNLPSLFLYTNCEECYA